MEPEAKFLLKMAGFDTQLFFKTDVDIMSPLHRSCWIKVIIFPVL